MTTRNEIAEWFDMGVAQEATHLVVVCDTFDHEDYPVYCSTPAECLARIKAPGDMQKVMEVYDLAADKTAQLNEFRAMHVPQKG